MISAVSTLNWRRFSLRVPNQRTLLQKSSNTPGTHTSYSLHSPSASPALGECREYPRNSYVVFSTLTKCRWGSVVLSQHLTKGNPITKPRKCQPELTKTLTVVAGRLLGMILDLWQFYNAMNSSALPYYHHVYSPDTITMYTLRYKFHTSDIILAKRGNRVRSIWVSQRKDLSALLSLHELKNINIVNWVWAERGGGGDGEEERETHVNQWLDSVRVTQRLCCKHLTYTEYLLLVTDRGVIYSAIWWGTTCQSSGFTRASATGTPRNAEMKSKRETDFSSKRLQSCLVKVKNRKEVTSMIEKLRMSSGSTWTHYSLTSLVTLEMIQTKFSRYNEWTTSNIKWW